MCRPIGRSSVRRSPSRAHGRSGRCRPAARPRPGRRSGAARSGCELRRELAHQGAEVHALLGREEDGELVAIPLPLGVGHLHRQAVRGDLLAHLAAHVVLALAQLFVGAAIHRAGAADDLAGRLGWAARALVAARLVGAQRAVRAAVALLLRHRAGRRHQAVVEPALGLDDHRLLGAQRLGVEPFEVRALRCPLKCTRRAGGTVRSPRTSHAEELLGA